MSVSTVRASPMSMSSASTPPPVRPPSTRSSPPRVWKPRSSASRSTAATDLVPARRQTAIRRRPGRARPRPRHCLMPVPAAEPATAKPRHDRPTGTPHQAAAGPLTHPRPINYPANPERSAYAPAKSRCRERRCCAGSAPNRPQSLEQSVDSISRPRTPCSSFAPTSTRQKVGVVSS